MFTGVLSMELSGTVLKTVLFRKDYNYSLVSWGSLRSTIGTKPWISNSLRLAVIIPQESRL